MADRIGQQLGNYRLIRLLGQRGLVTTYLGEHVLLGTQAAIKVVQTPLAQDGLEGFSNEARMIAGLKHPNIVRLIDFDVESSRHIPYLVMAFAPNGTLRQRHRRGERLPVFLVVSYSMQIASALQYAHDRQIIHRDVKPENMLVGANQEILLSDFGIAVVQSSRTQPLNSVAGTMNYMAPEQIQGRPMPASDQYALAVVVYEWLCGESPFLGSPTEIAIQQQYMTPIPLRQRGVAIPAAIEQVVLTALAKDPQARFESVRAFATMLEQASKAGPVSFPFPSASPADSQLSIPTELVSGPHLPQPPSAYQASPSVATGPTIQTAYGQQAPSTPPPSPVTPPVQGAPPLKSSRPGLSSLFSAAGDALEKVFSGRGRRRRKEFQLSLFAIARTALEEGDRAFVGKSYTVQAGIAQSKPENFAGEPFNLFVQSPTELIFFDVLLHTSENIEPVKEWQKHLHYDPRNPNPQLVEFTFKMIAPGPSSLVINFYRERRWLKTIRFEFDAIEKSMLTAVSSRG